MDIGGLARAAVAGDENALDMFTSLNRGSQFDQGIAAAHIIFCIFSQISQNGFAFCQFVAISLPRIFLQLLLYDTRNQIWLFFFKKSKQNLPKVI